MRAVKIIGLVIFGGILGFVFRSISYNGHEPIMNVDGKQIKSPRRAKKNVTPSVKKTRKKKEENKNI